LKDEEFAGGIADILEGVAKVLGGPDQGVWTASSGLDYRNDVFETRSFWAHSEDEIDEPHFRHYASGLEVWWYKRVGRSTESNIGMTALEWYRIVVECLESLKEAYEQR